jgi:hypothetical protein
VEALLEEEERSSLGQMGESEGEPPTHPDHVEAGSSPAADQKKPTSSGQREKARVTPESESDPKSEPSK